MQKQISIIIVNYNTPEETKACVRSLADLETWGFDYQIVVVDNGSKKPLKFNKTFLKKNPKVDLITSAGNLGFTGGNNLGIKHAVDQYDSDFILLLNSDTVVDKNFLKELYSCARSDPKIGLVGSKIYFAKGYEFHQQSYQAQDSGKVLWYAGGQVDWPNLLSFHVGVDEVDRGQFERARETDFVTGCAMLISREVIEKIGLLDNRFFLYNEDVDYSLRVKKAGFKVMFCPSSWVYHKIGQSTGGVGSPLQVYYQTRNRLLLAFKHAPRRYKLTAWRLALRLLFAGSKPESKAVIDLLFSNFGKQSYV